ncbi:hypothetical protein [Pontibacter ramchanderi]|nr:hypothetical protein [Pontibacter ramchanderi]
MPDHKYTSAIPYTLARGPTIPDTSVDARAMATVDYVNWKILT